MIGSFVSGLPRKSVSSRFPQVPHSRTQHEKHGVMMMSKGFAFCKADSDIDNAVARLLDGANRFDA